MGMNQKKRQQGMSIVLFAVALMALMALTALAIDGSNLYVARVELQNAADAGALAGARVLYTAGGEAINMDMAAGYDAMARAAATDNFSQGVAAEVLRVRRGHWSFGTRAFTQIARTSVCSLARDAATIDADTAEDTACVNAVEVVTQRNNTPVPAFFGRVVGLNDYIVRARAVAYVGYAGTLGRAEADQPIAICENALDVGDEYFCSIGRFIPSSDTTFGETGGYTDFNTEGACQGGTNTNLVRDKVCASGNQTTIAYGDTFLATMGGQSDATFDDIADCWRGSTTTKWFDEDGTEVAPEDPKATEQPTTPWAMTLPVIECLDANVGPCNRFVGAVNVIVPMIVHQANDIDADAPYEMERPDMDGDGDSDGTWTYDDTIEDVAMTALVEDGGCAKNKDGENVTLWEKDCRGIRRWNQFVDSFNILAPDDSLAYYNDDPQRNGWRQKTIYFLPNCTPHKPTGRTGGENFGVMSRIPVLVD